MDFIKKFVYSTLILSSVGYASTITLQTESYEQQSSNERLRLVDKQDLLKHHLPLQIEALETLQETFQSTIDAQKEQNPLEAFKAACTLANVQTLIGSTQDVLNCIQGKDPIGVNIGIGATPAIQQGIEQLVVYLNADGIDCPHLTELVKNFHKITRDIFNPEFRVD